MTGKRLTGEQEGQDTKDINQHSRFQEKEEKQ
jgi:hypothetical protein